MVSQGKVKTWLPFEQMGPGVWEQVEAVSRLPFIDRHVGVMPDAHVGKGACVGTVVATREAIVPAIVGVDIGCGVIWQQSRLRRENLPEDLAPLRARIEERIYLGHGKGYDRVEKSAMRYIDRLERAAGGRLAHYDQVLPHWRNQIGSLGSGNHFIELVIDDDGYVGGFLHSGSRGIGNRLAGEQIKLAQRLNQEKGIRLPDRDLAYFAEGTEEFDNYISDVRWCQDFAYCNRNEMIFRLMETVGEFSIGDCDTEAVGRVIHHNHNFTNWETHFGNDVWVTRKGAVPARTGELGLLPTAMGRASYIVEGMGNPESFCTAPHGAGRRMSRSAAKRDLDYTELVHQMEGVEWRQTASVLDEAPNAYKEPNEVLHNSRTLMQPVGELRPILNVKGL